MGCTTQPLAPTPRFASRWLTLSSRRSRETIGLGRLVVSPSSSSARPSTVRTIRRSNAIRRAWDRTGKGMMLICFVPGSLQTALYFISSCVATMVPANRKRHYYRSWTSSRTTHHQLPRRGRDGWSRSVRL